MYLFRILFFVSIVTFLFSSCGGESTTAKKPTITKTTPTTPTVQPAGKLVPNTLPSVTEDLMKEMWLTCTNVDFLFYNYSFSMNQTEPASIKNTLTYVSTSVPPELDQGCQPVGRVFFVANGEELIEADFYLGNVCNYFLFYQKGKQVAANLMTPKGEEFLKNTIKQVNGGMPK